MTQNLLILSYLLSFVLKSGYELKAKQTHAKTRTQSKDTKDKLTV